MPCRCRKGKGGGLRAAVTTTTTTIAVTVDGGVQYALLGSSGKVVGKYKTELEARAARVRAGEGVVKRIK